MTLGTGRKKEVHKNTGPFKNKYQKIKPNKAEGLKKDNGSPQAQKIPVDLQKQDILDLKQEKKKTFFFLTKQEDQADLGLKGNKPQNCFRPIISWNSHQSERGASWE